MDGYRLKVKIGQNEFEAEGDKETVERQFEAFRELVASLPSAPNLQAKTANDETLSEPQEVANGGTTQDQPLAKIFHSEGKVLSLSALPQGENRELDAVLLLLLGHKSLKSSDVVSADDLVNGLRQSGYSVERADRFVARGVAEGSIIKSGVRRGSRYRLTNLGLAKARSLAQELANMVS